MSYILRDGPVPITSSDDISDIASFAVERLKDQRDEARGEVEMLRGEVEDLKRRVAELEDEVENYRFMESERSERA